MLPLDLHVLGLPLAFILSQDQTLRCNLDLDFFRIVFIKVSGIEQSSPYSLCLATNFFKELLRLFFTFNDNFYLPLPVFIFNLSLFALPTGSYYPPKSACKGVAIFSLIQIIFYFFLLFFKFSSSEISKNVLINYIKELK